MALRDLGNLLSHLKSLKMLAKNPPDPHFASQRGDTIPVLPTGFSMEK
jgi:hypothetical protein